MSYSYLLFIFFQAFEVYLEFLLNMSTKYLGLVKLTLVFITSGDSICLFEKKGTSVDRSHEPGDFYQLRTDSPFARDMSLP